MNDNEGHSVASSNNAIHSASLFLEGCVHQNAFAPKIQFLISFHPQVLEQYEAVVQTKGIFAFHFYNVQINALFLLYFCQRLLLHLRNPYQIVQNPCKS